MVLLVGVYARQRRRRGDDDGVAQDGGHTPAYRLTETVHARFVALASLFHHIILLKLPFPEWIFGSFDAP